MRIACFIPAIRAQARFHDDLLRKLDGIPLIQRAILNAQSLGGPNQSIHVLTDSEEVALLAKRSKADHRKKSQSALARRPQDGRRRLDALLAQGRHVVVYLQVARLAHALRPGAVPTGQMREPARVVGRSSFQRFYA